MTNEHQVEREYTFSPQELQYLQTTQRLALERMQDACKGNKNFDDAELQVRNDLYALK
jgi:hypothetical protein